MVKFKKWVYKNGGPQIIGSKLGVKAHTVRSWVRGDRVPNIDTIEKIVKHSKGEIYFSDFLK